jgi:hypothetical protein
MNHAWLIETKFKYVGTRAEANELADPLTGKRYDLRYGVAKSRLAHTWTCECGAKWEACKRARRELQVCDECRRLNRGRPIGSTRPTGDGYVEIKVGPGQWRLEHRHAVEQGLGRNLSDTETVHHINGDRADNRLDNLQIRQGNQRRRRRHVLQRLRIQQHHSDQNP